MTIELDDDLVERIRIDNEEVTEVTIDGDVAFQLNADLVLDLFNTGAISADSLGLYEDTVFDSLEVIVGGNTDFTTQSVSQTTSGSNFDITVNGNYQPTSETITIEGSGDLVHVFKTFSTSSSLNSSFTADSGADVSDEEATISPTTNPLDTIFTASDPANDYTSLGVIGVDSNAVYIDTEGTYRVDKDTGVVEQKLSYYDYEISSVNSSNIYGELNASFATNIFAYDKVTGNEVYYREDHYDEENDTMYSGSANDNYHYVIVGIDSTNETVLSSHNSDTGDLQYQSTIDDTFADIHALSSNDGVAIETNGEVEIWNSGASSKSNTISTSSNSPVNETGMADDGSTLFVGRKDPAGVLFIDISTGNSLGLLNVSFGQEVNYIAVSDSYLIAGDTANDELALYELGSSPSTTTLLETDYPSSVSRMGMDNDGIYLSRNTDEWEKASFGTHGVNVTIGSDTYSYNNLTSSQNEYPSFNSGTVGVSASVTDGSIDIDIDYYEDDRPSDPSVTIDGSTISHSGPLGSFETETGNIDITGTGTYTASVSTNDEVTVDVDWTERDIVKDVDFTFNGVTESVTGPILNDDQSTLVFGVADINDGDNSVDVTAGGNSNPDLQLTFLLNTENAMALTDFEDNWDYDENGDNVLLEYWFNITDITVPDEVIANDSFTIEATVENIGITSAEKSVDLNTSEQSSSNTTLLEAKQSKTVTFTASLSNTGDETVYIETPHDTLSDLTTVLRSIPDTVLAQQSNSGRIGVFDLADGSEFSYSPFDIWNDIGATGDDMTGANPLASACRRFIFAGIETDESQTGNRTYWYVIDLLSGEHKPYSPFTPTDIFANRAFSASTTEYITSPYGYGVKIVDPNTGNETSVSPIQTGDMQLVTSTDIHNTTVAVGVESTDIQTNPNSLQVFDIETGTEKSYSPINYTNESDKVRDVGINSDYVVAVTDAPNLYIYDRKTGSELSYSPLSGGTDYRGVSMSSNYLAYTGNNGSSAVEVVDLSNGTEVSYSPIGNGIENDVTITDNYLAYCSGNEIYVHNPSDGTEKSYSPLTVPNEKFGDGLETVTIIENQP